MLIIQNEQFWLFSSKQKYLISSDSIYLVDLNTFCFSMGVVAKMQRIRDFCHRWFMGLRQKTTEGQRNMLKSQLTQITKREKKGFIGQILR